MFYVIFQPLNQKFYQKQFLKDIPKSYL